MFNVGGGEFMLIALIALLVLGPDKLPDFARKSARMIGQLRSMSQGFQNEMKSVIDLDEMKGLMNEGTGTMQGTRGPRLVGPIDEGSGPLDPSASPPDAPGQPTAAPSSFDSGAPSSTPDAAQATAGEPDEKGSSGTSAA